MKVCIATPSLDTCTETFIKTHIERLPFDVQTLSGPLLNVVGNGNTLQRSFSTCVFDAAAVLTRRNSLSASLNRKRVRWLMKNRVDCVLAEYGPTGVKILDTCRISGLPLVVHFHGYDAHSNEILSRHHEEYRKMFRHAAALIAVSRHMEEKLRSLGAPGSKLHYVPYFVDPSRFPPVEIQENANVMLSVGRFVEKKSPHLTILAFSKVLESRPECVLEMIGDGPLLGPCRTLAKALGVEHAIRFHGAREHEYVRKRMSEACVFVQHSIESSNGDCEGTPVAVLEAQCSGLPVIATRHAGIRDVVLHEQTGFLCGEGDANSMARMMNTVLSMNLAERKAMSRNARARVLEHFNEKTTLLRLTGIIQQAAS